MIDIGEAATPVMYFAVEQLGADAGAIVTASHNPPEFNGLKLRLSHPTYGSEPAPPALIQEVGQITLAQSFVAGVGHVTQHDVSADYIANVTKRLSFPHRRPKVVLDGGNGVAGQESPLLSTRLLGLK